ncbi:hypothetical protein L218DRAFT_1001826 [Marasmius fiardii PR-910]|nr:hypothetical protein L218DRAFT_1001826 [Marasmius fiardii PR-910]
MVAERTACAPWHGSPWTITTWTVVPALLLPGDPVSLLLHLNETKKPNFHAGQSACNIGLHSSYLSHEYQQENKQFSWGPSASTQLVNPRINQAVFNHLKHGNQYNYNHNFYTRDLLWNKIAGVGASHNSNLQVTRGSCLPGTCQAVSQCIQDWKSSESQRFPVCCLSGAAGVGKSAIALTIAKEWETDGLAASFFFFQSDSRLNNPDSLILSIAHSLVVTRPYLQDSVYQRVNSDPHILEAGFEEQYQELVLNNLNCSPPQFAVQPLDIVIIDGLDEWSDAATQNHILSIIFSTYQTHSPL